MELKKKFADFADDKKIFQEDVFFALLPLIDYEGDILPFINNGTPRRNFLFNIILPDQSDDFTMDILPGCIDCNLAYFDKTKKTLNSKNPIAKNLIRKLLYFTENERIYEICKKAYDDSSFDDPGLEGLFSKKNDYHIADAITGDLLTSKLMIFESKDFLWTVFSKSIEKYSKNAKRSGTRKSVYQAVMLIPFSVTFPLIDFMIFVPYGCLKGGLTTKPQHLLLLFLVSINANDHKHEESDTLIDIALRPDESPVIQTQFVWVRHKGNVESIPCHNSSWFMTSSDFNPYVKK